MVDKLKEFYGELKSRLLYLESEPVTDENTIRINELTLAIVRVQQILLNNLKIMQLTTEQITKAYTYYENHIFHIKKMIIEGSNNSYPPTDFEDKNDPRLWKPNHWKWFLETIYIQ